MMMRGLLSLAVIGAFLMSLSSCKDEPFVKPKLAFTESTLSFKESDGEVEIEVSIDKAYNKDIEIDYTISGTAGEEVAVGTSAAPDYKITSDYQKVTIKAGETTGIIKLEFYSDLEIEEDETIELQIEEVDSEEIEITRDDEVNITVKQEDGLLVVLAWGVQTGESYKDVDMDLFLWVPDSGGQPALSNLASAQESVQSPEFFFLPSAVLNDGKYGLSCNYYSGTVDPMNFQVSYIKVINGANGGTTVKKATYTKANINPWYTSNVDPLLVMTFNKAGTEFKDFSDITVPTSGSRVTTGMLPLSVKRTPPKN